MASLYVYSLFTTKLEDVADELHEQEVPVESRVISCPRSVFINWLSELSGVAEREVDILVSLLTFDSSHPHVTCAHQPLVLTRDKWIHLLPRALLFLDFPTMYVAALNKTKDGRDSYAKAIVEIENAGVSAIATDLRSTFAESSQLVEKVTFRQTDSTEISPDIVLVDSQCNVLVIDTKYATPPLGPRDVFYDVEEMKKWKKRMSDYVRAFVQQPEVLRQHFQLEKREIAKVFGLILLRWPLPIPCNFDERVQAVDWPSLQEHLSATDIRSIEHLVQWTQARPDLRIPTSLSWNQKSVTVENWIYEYAVLSPANSSA